MKNKWFVFLVSGVLLIILFAVGAYLFKQTAKEKLQFLATEQSEVFVRDHSPRYGNEQARVILIEFLDPECESCRAFYPYVKSLLEEFKDQLQLVVRYAPFHHNSKMAIQALEAARMQGKYWEALEVLFYYQPQWGDHHDPKPELIFDFLAEIDLNMEKLRQDMKNPAIQKIIDQDEQDLRTLNVRGTPTFFVNGKMLQTFTAEALRYMIQQEIKATYE